MVLPKRRQRRAQRLLGNPHEVGVVDRVEPEVAPVFLSAGRLREASAERGAVVGVGSAHHDLLSGGRLIEVRAGARAHGRLGAPARDGRHLRPRFRSAQIGAKRFASVARRACAFRTAYYGRLSARVARWSYRRRLHVPLRVLRTLLRLRAQRLCRCEVLKLCDPRSSDLLLICSDLIEDRGSVLYRYRKAPSLRSWSPEIGGLWMGQYGS